MQLFKTGAKNWEKYVNTYRKKYIPKKFNQIELVDELLNNDLDHYISISSRSDGKSFNYISFFMKFSIDEDVKFMLLSRNFTVRQSYMELVNKITKVNPAFDEALLGFLNTQYYVKILYGDKTIGIITDLNSATNLKYASNFLQDFPIMIYDEFLALEGDYLSDEWEKLKTIYGSVNRVDEIPFINFPKIFYLGNAVNFSSPILSNLDLFNKLEKHKINTVRKYDNTILEMRNNVNQNEIRNLRAFAEENDKFTQGQFEINSHNIANDTIRKNISTDRYTIIIKLESKFLRIDYNPNNEIIILSILGHSDFYDYNTEIKDNNEDSIFLTDRYFSDNEHKKHVKSYYYYDNNYSKDFITSDYKIISLKLMRIISEHLTLKSYQPDFDRIEEKYNQSYEEITKRNLFRKFL